MNNSRSTLIIPILLFIVFNGCSPQSRQAKNQVCFKDMCVDVEVVQNTEDLTRGLQFRESLDANKGMLFIFPHSRRQSFWMKDTFIPLDMIWINQALEVVHIARDVPPCRADPCPTYVPSLAALYVLEVNAGGAADLGITVGDKVEFRL